jgi:hypothetical protein
MCRQSDNHQKALLSTSQISTPTPCYKYPSKPRHQFAWATGDVLKSPHLSPLSPFLSCLIKLCCCFAICMGTLLSSLFGTPKTWDLLDQDLLKSPTSNILVSQSGGKLPTQNAICTACIHQAMFLSFFLFFFFCMTIQKLLFICTKIGPVSVGNLLV